MTQSPQHGGVRHWVFTTSPQNLVTCLRHCVFGVDNAKYGITATRLVRPGDLVLFYVRSLRKGGTPGAPSKCQRVFLGPYRVKNSGALNPNHPAVNQWSPPGQYQVLIEIEKTTDKIGAVDVNALLNVLYFITNKARSGRGGWQDHMQFSIISIRGEDYNTIIKNLNPNHPCTDQLRRLLGTPSQCA
ncbi:MAG: EVE domain-containing protein [Vulcanisaeta sp.]